MTRPNGLTLGLLIALSGALPSRPARAESAARYSLVYSAPADCPNEQAFVQAIEARAPLATRSETSPGDVVFEAHIRAESGVSRGFLLVRLAGGGETRRDVPDASCDEIVASMAVIAALVIEGLSGSSPAATTTENNAGTNPKPTPAPTSPPPAPKPPLAPTARAPARAPPPTPPPLNRQPASQQREPASAWRVGLAAGVGIESAIFPEPAPVFAAGIDVSARSTAVFSPSARISGLYAQSGDKFTADGTARFQWLAARLALCPVLYRKQSFSLRPCVELDAGELRGEGDATTNGRTASLFWFGAGTALHAELAFGQVLALNAELGGRVLAQPGEFKFLPDTLAHDTRRLSLGALLGLVARLP